MIYASFISIKSIAAKVSIPQLLELKNASERMQHMFLDKKENKILWSRNSIYV